MNWLFILTFTIISLIVSLILTYFATGLTGAPLAFLFVLAIGFGNLFGVIQTVKIYDTAIKRILEQFSKNK